MEKRPAGGRQRTRRSAPPRCQLSRIENYTAFCFSLPGELTSQGFALISLPGYGGVEEVRRQNTRRAIESNALANTMGTKFSFSAA
jgi:hypothetical protein